MKEKIKSHRPLLLVLFAIAYLTNLFDLGFTLYVLEYIPHAFEMNPVFRLMLQTPLLLYCYKLVLIPLLMFAMYYVRELRIARFGIWLSAIFYTVNMIYQIWSICLW